MTDLELVDKLCEISRELLEIIKRQNGILQQADVPDGIREGLMREERKMERRMETLEHAAWRE